MKKKNLTYLKIKDLVIYTCAIFAVIFFLYLTYDGLKKKYILREKGVTIKAAYKYKERRKKVRASYHIYFYKFEANGTEYMIESRHSPPSNKWDSVEVVILPDDPGYNAIKSWVDQSWLVPPYFQ